MDIKERSGDMVERKMASKKGWWKWAVAAVVVIGLAVAGWFLVQRLTAPVVITKLETTNAASSRVTDAEVKSKFAVREPVMVHFEYDSAKVGEAVKFELKDGEGKVVRTGSTTVLRPDGANASNGQRYISLVSSGMADLTAGKYKVRLFVGDRGVGGIEFEVE